MLQVLRKEQATSEDSAFLKGQMEALLKVSAMLPARGLQASLPVARSPPL